MRAKLLGAVLFLIAIVALFIERRTRPEFADTAA